MKKDSPLCPICLASELIIKEGKMQEGQNVCADCGNLTCLKCGGMEPSVTSKVSDVSFRAFAKLEQVLVAQFVNDMLSTYIIRMRRNNEAFEYKTGFTFKTTWNK